MKRYAFTLVLNGLHHLLHNDYAEKVTAMVDEWIVVEGASENNGSTVWCNPSIPSYHNNGRSIDGTYEYLDQLQKKHLNVHLLTADRTYHSKDEQVGLAINKIASLTTDPIFLWQIDVDEQWNKKSLQIAEDELTSRGANVGKFFWNYYVGPGLLAKGCWGEKSGGPGVARLWHWNKNKVIKHEPPLFDGLKNAALLPQMCNHFAYFYEKDVLFKSCWYRGYEKIIENWRRIQECSDKTMPMDYFLSGVKTNTQAKIIKESWIERMDQDELIMYWD